MRTTAGKRRLYSGYSLGEMLAALVIGAMVLTSVLSIYGRANQASEAVARKIDSPALATEVVQLIAQDMDRLVGSSNTAIELKNGYDNGFARAELVLRRTFHNAQNQEQTLDEIIWRAGYDYEGGVPGLVLYRSFSGMAPEDKLLDSRRDPVEKNYPFVPICRGVTFFRIEVTNGERTTDAWSGSALPPGLKVSLSFSQPHETIRGTLDVDEEDKTIRSIAIDRTRTIRFSVAPAPTDSDAPESNTNNAPRPRQLGR
ncbi:MAG: hypothetical protein JW993_09295 [Sedimentisphaerales bacterium]|nr:hypothetical protein [Sedimentisphaerales bacterium]